MKAFAPLPGNRIGKAEMVFWSLLRPNKLSYHENAGLK
jgi:hypothetical protein